MAPLSKMPPSATAPKRVRNRGPFPYIQSEGGFIDIPGTRSWKKQNEPTSSDKSKPPVNLASFECGTVLLNDSELEAMVRYRQNLDLQKPLPKLAVRKLPTGPPGEPATKEDNLEDAEKWLPPRADPFASPQWAEGLSPWDRLAMHHTLNSVRSNARMHRPGVYQSELELLLNSIFDQSTDMWANKNEVVLQAETCDFPTWRVLKNTRVYVPEPASVESYKEAEPHAAGTTKADAESKVTSDRKHPVRYGGITAKLSPHSVKLAISGNHVSQTNAGYSRKVGGSFYS